MQLKYTHFRVEMVNGEQKDALILTDALEESPAEDYFVYSKTITKEGEITIESKFMLPEFFLGD